MTLTVELEQEDDGRWIGEVPALPGALAYGATREAALAAVEALALRVLADRIENGEAPAGSMTVTFESRHKYFCTLIVAQPIQDCHTVFGPCCFKPRTYFTRLLATLSGPGEILVR